MNQNCRIGDFKVKDKIVKFTNNWLNVFLICEELSTKMEKLFPKMPKMPTIT